MLTHENNHETISIIPTADFDLLISIEAFLLDKRAQNASGGTIEFYHTKLKNFSEFCESRAIRTIAHINANEIRQFMFYLEYRGHNPGGCHAHYRTIRAFLNWWELEIEPDDWKNPMRKTKPPRVDIEPLDPVKESITGALLNTCEKGTFYGDRDSAIVLLLMDTGVRASELLSIDIDDVNILNGSIMIKAGKGGKYRSVFFGKKTRKALRIWLRHCEQHGPLFHIQSKQRLTYSGLREVIRRRAKRAGVEAPSLHSFRRFFALQSLRNGMNIYSLQAILGHADLQVLRRYLKQTDDDIKEDHAKSSPVDNN